MALAPSSAGSTRSALPRLRAFLGLIASAGGLPDLDVVGEKPLQWRSGPAGDKRLLFITNQSAAQTVRVARPGGALRLGQDGRELRTDARIKIKHEDGEARFKVEIGAGEFAILRWG